jgi:predicted Rossmann fold nucleotide-binding protein DprA/Smf involved in DNA uptake
MSTLSPDTQVALLLTGEFGGRAAGGLPPLTLPEYNQVAKTLVLLGKRPGDLLASVPEEWNELMEFEALHSERLSYLLGRGLAMADAMNKWMNRGIKVIGRSDSAYPTKYNDRLKNARPPVLYVVGNTQILERTGFAMVGSRVTTPAILDWRSDRFRRCQRRGLGRNHGSIGIGRKCCRGLAQ